MKIVRERLNKNFIESADPIDDMNIGKRGQIIKDLIKIDLFKKDVYINNDYTFFMKDGKRQAPDTLLDVQLKHFPPEKKQLLADLEKTHKPIMQVIDQAVKDKIPLKEIKEITDYVFSYISYRHPRSTTRKTDKNSLFIYFKKLKRSKDDIKYDVENNIYVFIGYEDKMPVIINGKRYYEDKFQAEKLIKIDKYNAKDLSMVSAMKMRARFGNAGTVYTLSIPKEFMDNDYYDGIPEEYRYIIEKYKKRI